MLGIFLNEIEAIPDLFIVDEEKHYFRMVNYDLKNIRVPSLMENESLIHVDAEIGVCDNLSIIFDVIFELTVIKKDDKWKVGKYELISKSSEFNKMYIEVE